jgi:hypothetical protein
LKAMQASPSRVPVVRPVFPITGLCSPKYGSSGFSVGF